ncbi:hypothetical protein DAPPUDRAFT_338190 [Daphnia pulex]|uniref:Uncharacterized protein n=1 Tax=Daphnia pulex TaxID=6669 RepID=E9I2K6_DAPPU|nr:hypothetical protein DAPPUDRAFT_338190 [Daphnia pulex]|eukprot:EFX61774.1 hypothetical protein DAPPUDRAFT_338190 [Daphnia pulex]
MSGSADDIKVLKEYVIADVDRYAKDMGLTTKGAEWAAAMTKNVIRQIENVILNCDTRVDMEGVIIGSTPLQMLRIVAKHNKDHIKADVYLFKTAEDVWKRIRKAYFDEFPPNFNNMPGLSKCGTPWIITDSNAYACRFRIDIPQAIEICNSLLECNAALEASNKVEFRKQYEKLADMDFREYDMTLIQRVELAEDLYARIRVMMLKSCVTLDKTEYDQRALMLMFYQQRRKIENAAKRCA